VLVLLAGAAAYGFRASLGGRTILGKALLGLKIDDARSGPVSD
jgi:hypothetical protein